MVMRQIRGFSRQPVASIALNTIGKRPWGQQEAGKLQPRLPELRSLFCDILMPAQLSVDLSFAPQLNRLVCRNEILKNELVIDLCVQDFYFLHVS